MLNWASGQAFSAESRYEAHGLFVVLRNALTIAVQVSETALGFRQSLVGSELIQAECLGVVSLGHEKFRLRILVVRVGQEFLFGLRVGVLSERERQWQKQ